MKNKDEVVFMLKIKKRAITHWDKRTKIYHQLEGVINALEWVLQK